MIDLVLKRFEQPDEIREFEKGRFEIVRVGGVTLGRATYQPGWHWSTHVGALLHKTTCDVEHVGFVLSGQASVEMDDGPTLIMKAGDVFHVGPGHDSRVIGDEPYVSIHLMGTEKYAVE